MNVQKRICLKMTWKHEMMMTYGMEAMRRTTISHKEMLRMYRTTSQSSNLIAQRKIREVGVPDRRKPKKVDVPSTKRVGERKSSPMEHGAPSELNRTSCNRVTTQFRPSTQLDMRKQMWCLKLSTTNGFRLRTDHHVCFQGVYLKSTRWYLCF